MTVGKPTTWLVVLLALTGFLQAQLAQGDAPPKPGVVPAGSIVIRCPDAACTVSLSGVSGTVSLPAHRGTILSDIPGGAHDVTVRAEGTSRRVHVDICGNRVTLTATADGIQTSGSSCPAFGYLSLSAPKASDVAIAGRALPDRGSQRIAIYVGTVSFDVSLKGYKTYTGTATIKEGTETDITARPQPQPGIASIGGVKGVTHLSVDGVDVIRQGELQSTSLKVAHEGADLQVSLAPGKHVVKATRPDYAPFDATFDLKSGAHASWMLAFKPLPATWTLKVWPRNAAVSLDGTTVDASQPQVVPAGPHKLTVTASGFAPLTKPVTAAPNGKQEIDVTLVGHPVSVVFRGVPAGATVRVDGGKSASAMEPLSVRPGPHTFRVSAPGYASLTKRAIVTTTAVQWIDAALEKLGHVAISVDPASSTVSVDGATVPVTAGQAEADVPPGTHSVTAKAENYASKTATVTVDSGKKTPVQLTLTPVPAVARLTGLPSGATVTLDGRRAKVTDGTVSIPTPGKHTLVVGSPVLVAKSFPVATAPGGKVTLDMGHFDTKPATITLKPVPPGTRVLIDDQPVKAYTGPLQLQPGSHTIWVAAAGYKRTRLDLTVRAGQQETIDPGLEPAGN